MSEPLPAEAILKMIAARRDLERIVAANLRAPATRDYGRNRAAQKRGQG